MSKNVEITHSPLSETYITKLVTDDSHGAIVLFQGVTRNNTGDRKVLFLEYEAYIPMAEKTLNQVRDEIMAKWNVKIAIHHRIGKVDIGHSSLLVAVGAPHREAAFEACQYSVDKIKQIVPIWKKEHFVGGEVWIGDADGFRPIKP
jgi:molybdopterin synthase catalytic subunit